MKIFLLALMALVLLSTTLFPESRRRITQKNEFGGITEERSFVKGDKFFDKISVVKNIGYYDKEGTMMKADFLYTPAFSANRGYEKRTEYYATGLKPVRGEYYYTPAFIEKKGYFKATDIYDSKSKVIQSEYEYSEKFSGKSGYTRSVAVLFQGFIKQWEYYLTEKFQKELKYHKRIDIYVYDPYGNGKVTEMVYFDREGKEIRREKK